MYSKVVLSNAEARKRFPLLKLPLELRREIYQYALCPRAIFIVREGLHRVRTDRGPNEFGYLYSHSEGHYLEGFTVSPKLFLSTISLLVANKQISSEVITVLSSIHNLLKQARHFGEPTESTDPRFLSLVKCGRFEFLGNSGAAFAFLGHLRGTTLSSIRSILFTHDCLYYKSIHYSPFVYEAKFQHRARLNDAAWGESISGGQPGRRHAPFPHFLRHKTPRLREITLVAPIFESHWYCSFAAAEVLFLLDESLIDTVRLLFTEDVPWHYDIKLILLKWVRYGRYMLGFTRCMGPESKPTREERGITARLDVVREDMGSNLLDARESSEGAEVKAIFSVKRKSSLGLGV